MGAGVTVGFESEAVVKGKEIKVLVNGIPLVGYDTFEIDNADQLKPKAPKWEVKEGEANLANGGKTKVWVIWDSVHFKPYPMDQYNCRDRRATHFLCKQLNKNRRIL